MPAEAEWIHLQKCKREREEHVRQLTERIKRGQEQVVRKGQNSSLLPSADRFVRQKQTGSGCTQSGQTPGGLAAGHQGHTFIMSVGPAESIPRTPLARYQHRQADISEIATFSIAVLPGTDVSVPPHLCLTPGQKAWQRDLSCQRSSLRALFSQERRAALQEQIKAALSWIHQKDCGQYLRAWHTSTQIFIALTLTSSQVRRIQDQRATAEQRILMRVGGTSADVRADCSCRRCISLLRSWFFLFHEMRPWWASKIVRTQRKAGASCPLDLVMPCDHYLPERDLWINRERRVSWGALYCADGAMCPVYMPGTLTPPGSQRHPLSAARKTTLRSRGVPPAFWDT
jgi:hypothetical protein